MAKQVDTTYGNALFELAKEENKLDVFFEEAQALVQILNDNGDLLKLLDHPQIDKDEKEELLGKLFNGKVEDALTGLMVMATDKGHGAKLIDILQYFIKLVKEEKKIGVAAVTSAVCLSDQQKSEIENRLIETTNYESMEITYSVDAALIGGLVIRIQDRVVDSSIRTKLEKMSYALSN